MQDGTRKVQTFQLLCGPFHFGFHLFLVPFPPFFVFLEGVLPGNVGYLYQLGHGVREELLEQAMVTHSSTPADVPKSDMAAKPINDSLSRSQTHNVFHGVVLSKRKRTKTISSFYTHPNHAANHLRLRRRTCPSAEPFDLFLHTRAP
jgi:hypothetical protein